MLTVSSWYNRDGQEKEAPSTNTSVASENLVRASVVLKHIMWSAVVGTSRSTKKRQFRVVLYAPAKCTSAALVGSAN